MLDRNHDLQKNGHQFHRLAMIINRTSPPFVKISNPSESEQPKQICVKKASFRYQMRIICHPGPLLTSQL